MLHVSHLVNGTRRKYIKKIFFFLSETRTQRDKFGSFTSTEKCFSCFISDSDSQVNSHAIHEKSGPVKRKKSNNFLIIFMTLSLSQCSHFQACHKPQTFRHHGSNVGLGGSCLGHHAGGNHPAKRSFVGKPKSFFLTTLPTWRTVQTRDSPRWPPLCAKSSLEKKNSDFSHFVRTK